MTLGRTSTVGANVSIAEPPSLMLTVAYSRSVSRDRRRWGGRAESVVHGPSSASQVGPPVGHGGPCGGVGEPCDCGGKTGERGGG